MHVGRGARQEFVADRIHALISRVLGRPLPLAIQAWDSSVAGPDDVPLVVVRNRRALRRLMWSPNELALQPHSAGVGPPPRYQLE